MTQPSPEQDQEIKLVGFQIGHQRFVLNIRELREIIRMQPITPIPKAPAFLEGIIDLRGKVIPVVDLRKRFNVPPPEDHKAERIMIAKHPTGSLGLVVDSVSSVIPTRESAIQPAPQYLDEAEAEFLRGVMKHEDTLHLLLNLDRLLTQRETASLEGAALTAAAPPAPADPEA